MTRGVQDLKFMRADLNYVSFRQVTVRVKAVSLLSRVDKYFPARQGLEIGVSSCMIPMAVSVDNCGEREVVFL